MESIATNDDLKVKVTNKQILSIAMPITLAILIPQVNMLTNSIFLGKSDDANALGNAGITGVYYLIFAVAGHGLNNAMQSVFSRHAGSGNTGAFKTILSQGIRICLQLSLIGILFTWFIAPFILQPVADANAYQQEISFLRIRIFGLPFLYLFQMGNAFLVASLNSRYLMIGFIFEALLNIVLDYVFIYGHFGFPKMGFNGAALASVIAEGVGFLVVLIVLYKTGLKKKYNLLKDLAYDKVISKAIIKVSAPLVAQYVISVTTWLIFFFLIEARGNALDKAISNVMRNVFGLAGVFVWAFASTSNVVVSNLMGQKREDKVILAINKTMLLSISFCAVMVLLLNIFPEMFFRLFSKGDAFVAAGIPVARTVSLGMLFMSVANIWLNGVTGTGKTKVNLMIEIVAITVYLIYSWIFMKVHFISLAMAWSNEVVYWSTIFIMAFVFLKSGKWKTKQA
ncbi:MATE family efflux transporter [Ferruginibacter sp. SUN106]|uniref:MATE family efflux transporter n=1 Tax=Ferruginibacter sp. SUN106 TaxID=2978348 RepID=UPI003D36EDD3